MRHMLIVAALCFVSHSCHGQALYGFELCTPGTLFGTCSPAEPWIPGGGTTTIEPLAPLTAPTSGFPTEAVQWAVVSSIGATGGPAAAGGHIIPAGGPLARPINPNSTGAIRIALPLPVLPMGTALQLVFSYTYVSLECANDATYNDCLTIDLVQNGVVVAPILYFDTFSTAMMTAPALTPYVGGFVLVGFTCAVGNGPWEVTPAGAPKTVNFTVPPALYGQTVDFEVHLANGTDTAFGGYVHLDNLGYSFVSSGPTIALTQPGGAGTGVFLGNGGLNVGGEYYNVISIDTSGPVGGGPYLGIYAGSPVALQFIFDQLVLPLGFAPFHYIAPAASINFGPFSVGPATIDGICLGIVGGAIANNSTVSRLTIL